MQQRLPPPPPHALEHHASVRTAPAAETIPKMPQPKPPSNNAAPDVQPMNPPFRPPPRTIGRDALQNRPVVANRPEEVTAPSHADLSPSAAADEAGAWSKEAFELFDWRPPRLRI
jgi:hypothetical protein